MSQFKSKNLHIWSDVLREENLCETLNKIDILDAGAQDTDEDTSANFRGVESYAYKNDKLNEVFREAAKAKAAPSSTSKHQSRPSLSKSKRRKLKRLKNQAVNSPTLRANTCADSSLTIRRDSKPMKERLGPLVTFDESKTRAHILVSELDSEEMVAKEIATCLREPKGEIISNEDFLMYYSTVAACGCIFRVCILNCLA